MNRLDCRKSVLMLLNIFKNKIDRYFKRSGVNFTKPCALLKLDFLTRAYNKMHGVSQTVQL